MAPDSKAEIAVKAYAAYPGCAPVSRDGRTNSARVRSRTDIEDIDGCGVHGREESVVRAAEVM